MSIKAIKYNFIYYVRVWFAIVKKSLNKSMAFQFEFASKLLRMLLIVFLQVILVQSLYSGTEYIKGWSIDEYYLLLGTFNFVNYLGWGIFNINLWRLEERILKGEFDFLLLLPTGSIFSASMNEFFLDDAIGSVSGIVLIVYYLVRHSSSISIANIGMYGAAIIIAFVIWFSMHLFFAAVNFLAVKNGLMDLIKNLSRVGSFPIDIFSQSIRLLLYSIFPIAFIAAVPSRLLSGAFSLNYLIFGFVIAVLGYVLTRKFWYYCIRSYTSSGG